MLSKHPEKASRGTAFSVAVVFLFNIFSILKLEGNWDCLNWEYLEEVK
jgi:hypothetical protein